MRRWISLILTVAMVFPAVAAAAEGTMANWLSPQPGQIVSGGRVEVSIGYNTGSSLKVSSLELYVDGRFHSRKILFEPQNRGVCSFAWDTTRVEQGSHNLVVKVFAGDQLISKVFGTGTVGPQGSRGALIDVRPPIVTFANIRAGDVLKGVKTVKMNAADDSGKHPMVSLLVDENLKLLRNTPPYTYDLDTTTYTDGDHSLKTYAYDEAGNRSDPAVIKVAFRNGDTKPVVTTMTVTPVETPDTVMPPAKSSTLTPPSLTTDVQPPIKQSAARVAAPSVAPSSAVPVVKPAPKPAPQVAAVPKVVPKLVAMAKPAPKAVSAPAPAVKVTAPVLSSGPVKVASAAGSTGSGATTLKPSVTASVQASKPAVTSAPSLSGLRNASATRLPVAKQAQLAAPAVASGVRSAAPKSIAVATAPKPVAPKVTVAAIPKPVEPKRVVTASKPSEPVRMAMAPAAPVVKKSVVASVPGPDVAVAPSVIGKPASSPLKIVPVNHSAAVKGVNIADATPCAAKAVAPKIVTAPKVVKPSVKNVRVAMAPNIRSANERLLPRPAVSSPPAPAKQAKARLEKAAIIATGKVKARTFFEKMGGVLFWDPKTHTVTACVANMVIELRIGDKTAKVNGHKFQMAMAPYIVGGRTFFEARTFTQACGLLESLKSVGVAELP